MAWVIVAGEGLVILVLLIAVRSFGQWTEQLLEANRSHEVLIRELQGLTARLNDNAVDHAARFVYDPNEEEEAS